MTEKRLPAFATENDIGWRWISGRPAYAFVAVVTLVAAILRLLYLGKESLWGDEAFTVALASIPLPTMLKLLATDEPNIALYVLMLRGWLALGDSESTIRLLSVVFAVATVPLLYCVARRLAGQPVALLTILLFAVNAWAIRYAQEARGYTLWMMLTLASWLFFLRSLERPTRWNLG
ncbi:glycosyltransferase family 39 protein, partial [Candidatus Binatus sp.]